MVITREAIRAFFRSNLERGTTLDREMLWGFFFIHPSERTLLDFGRRLQSLGYRLVAILVPAEGDDHHHLHLHLERTEQHSSASLYRRCVELDSLASQDAIAFDGFDVGNVDGSPLRRGCGTSTPGRRR